MNDSDQRERELFCEAMEIGSPQEQEAFVRGACRGDEAMLGRLRSLLRAHDSAGDFMRGEEAQSGSPGVDVTERMIALSEEPGVVVGRYKLLQRIGEGGFGVVYMAEQREPIKRRVALKIIKLGMDTKQVVARFEAERQALAMMDHPNIAKVLDGGATESGRPYFVMELVKGVSLLEFCDEHKLSTVERLRLFCQVCLAIHHAHQKGIIHRDIKPSNVLVTMHDDRAVPKVIDFGVAKATRHELTEKTVFTRYQEFIGTPAYMSPEQAQFSGLDIDTRTDIYSLGVLLYELIVGRTPFDSSELLSGGYDGMRQIIREKEPVKPSTRLKTLSGEDLRTTAQLRRVEPSRLPSEIRGDLDWIVMKALEKNRARRYESAFAMARDVECFLDNEPVSAVPPSLSYRFGRFARRHRATLGASLAIAVCLVAGTVVSTVMAVRAVRAERQMGESLTKELAARRTAQEAAAEARDAEGRASEEAEIAAAVNRFLNEEFLGQADPMKEPDRDIRLRELLDGASERIEKHFTGHPLVEASIRQTIGQVYLNLADYSSAEKHARRAVALREEQLGASHLDSLRSRTLLAAVGYRQGHYAQVESELKKLLVIAKLEAGESSELTLEITHWLAQSYLQTSKKDIAKGLIERALELSREALPRDHWLRAAIEGSWGRFLLLSNRFEEAEEYFTDWLEKNSEELGEEHPYTLTMTHYLAFALQWRDKPGEAEQLYRKVLATVERVLGPEHPGRFSTMEALAMLLSRQKRYDEAERILLEVFEGRKRVLGETHPLTRTTVMTLYGVYEGAGKLDVSKEFLLKVLQRDPENAPALDALGQLLDRKDLRVVLPASDEATGLWRYTLEEPGADWMEPGYDDSGWEVGEAPFANTTNVTLRTWWKTRSIWLRREFDLVKVPEGRLVLSLLQDDTSVVFINGTWALERAGWTGRRFRLSFAAEGASRALKPGRNVIAVQCQNVNDEGVIDAGLYVELPEASLFGAGQP